MNGEVELVGAFTNEEQLVHCIGESSVPTENLALSCIRCSGRWSSLVPLHNRMKPARRLFRRVKRISPGDSDSLAEKATVLVVK